MKNRLKKLLSPQLIAFLRGVIYSYRLFPYYFTCFREDITLTSYLEDERSVMSRLLVVSHVLEKGLTMPNRRLGFGYERVRAVLDMTKSAIENFTENHIEIQSTLKDLEQYLEIHEEAKYELPLDINNGIKTLLSYKIYDTVECCLTTSTDYFEDKVDFLEFAYQRRTVRQYTDKIIDHSLLEKVFTLAQTAPSACNRQSVRAYIVESKQIKESVLKLQNGNRGFGHLADKIILITSDMRCWSFKDRHSAYLDAGIYTQNLLYSLHYYKLCACTLNADMSVKNRKKLRNIIGLSKYEIPIVFISIGHAEKTFMIAGSQRLQAENVYTIL